MQHKEKTDYQPIDCDYYDRLEAWATVGTTCAIRFAGDDGQTNQVSSKILDFKIDDGVEYLIGEDNLRIRLDRLIAVNGIPLEDGRP